MLGKQRMRLKAELDRFYHTSRHWRISSGSQVKPGPSPCLHSMSYFRRRVCIFAMVKRSQVMGCCKSLRRRRHVMVVRAVAWPSLCADGAHAGPVKMDSVLPQQRPYRVGKEVQW